MTVCQVPVETVENTLFVFQEAVGAFSRVHGFGSFRRPVVNDRAAKATDDTGRFDDESR